MLKITYRVTSLVTDLFNEGYEGTAEITNKYPSGAKRVLGDAFSIQLSGFCKESLFITEQIQTHDIWFVGRYDEMRVIEVEPTVADIVHEAWAKYQIYKHRGYALPDEFKRLFIKYGLLIEETTTQTVYRET